MKIPNHVTRLNQVDLVSDFNGSRDNLGRDGQFLECRDPREWDTGVVSRDYYVNRGNLPLFKRPPNIDREKAFHYNREILLGKNEDKLAFSVRLKESQTRDTSNIIEDFVSFEELVLPQDQSPVTDSGPDLFYLFVDVYSDYETLCILS